MVRHTPAPPGPIAQNDHFLSEPLIKPRTETRFRRQQWSDAV